MEYYRILNLSREPFSNSPDPDFFFHSRQHVACLQKLELSIRLRRGLNVVIGDVGTGKTTLCRQLIRKLADDPNVETHLLLDPHFTTSMEFLGTLASMMGIRPAEEAGDSGWQLKEGIKKLLFQRGLDEGKTVVIIIDEGQKLPDFGIEILRELLNYETNEFKLLQIVIFAQTEFRKAVSERPNFADRINYLHVLGPLSFGDTRALIQFRLNQARDDYHAPRLFTYLGYLALYRASEGFPRKIIHLCHRVLLTLIVQNRPKAGWTMVWWCSRMLFPSRFWVLKALFLPLMACLLVALLLGFLLPPLHSWLSGRHHLLNFSLTPPQTVATVTPGSRQPDQAPQEPTRQDSGQIPEHPSPGQDIASTLSTPGPPPVHAQVTLDEAANPEPSPPSTELTAAPPSADMPGQGAGQTVENGGERMGGSDSRADGMPPRPASNVPMGWQSATAPPRNAGRTCPAMLGEVRVKEKEVLNQLVRRVYGTSDGEHLKIVMEANPELREAGRIRQGQVIRFPAAPWKAPRDVLYRWYLQVGEKDSLQEALDMTRASPPEIPLRVLPCWNSLKGLVFPVVLQTSFSSEATARQNLEKLPSRHASTATVLDTWDDSRLFFAR